MEISNATNYRDSIATLLEAEMLPVSDLPDRLENFRVALKGEEVTGVAGLEIYGGYGLLRSLVVKPGYRSQGIAGKLLKKIEDMAIDKGLNTLYLLTETAPGYFTRKKYIEITRVDVPAEIQRSSEFSYVCPQSAIVMKKIL